MMVSSEHDTNGDDDLFTPEDNTVIGKDDEAISKEGFDSLDLFNNLINTLLPDFFTVDFGDQAETTIVGASARNLNGDHIEKTITLVEIFHLEQLIAWNGSTL